MLKVILSGATISPYKSYRLYWQSELLFNKLDFDEDIDNFRFKSSKF